MRPTTLSLVALLSALLTAPHAAAHATYSTDDGAYLVIIGYKGEPVYTYQTTGLDLIIRENATGGPVAGAHETLEAALISPSGQVLIGVLEPQHGATHRYQFTEGFVLTEPGFYRLRLSGAINGSAIDGEFQMAHATKANSEIMFPDKGLKTLQELQAEVEVLRSENAALAERVDDLEADTKGAPAPGIALALGALAPVLLVGRRR